LVVESLEAISRYEIVGELGSGAMSRVYLAHDPNLDRKVALKVVLTNLTLDSDAQRELQKRFLLEARAAGKLTHPGIVSVYDADTDPVSGAPYIAMEWIQGRSLRSLLDEHKRIPIPRATEILSQVAAALDYAHSMGRIHRDIKPSNILMARDGRAKISDFGVAKIVAEPYTVSGQILGTPLYMSPEQVKDEPIDGRSDLFSLGVVLYQCVTGQLPFAGDSLAKVVYKILHTDPHPPQLERSEGAMMLREVMERALMKDPGGRYQTGADFSVALDRVTQAYAGEAKEGASPPLVDPTPTPGTQETGLPSITADDSSAATAPTWQLSTGEIKEAIDSGSNIDLDDPAAATPPPRPRETGPLWKSARRLLLGVVWAGLLVALTAVMVGRTTGRPPVPAIGITEPFTFPPDQATPDQIATTPDDDGTQGQQQIGFPTSPPLPEPEAVAPPAKKNAVKTPRRQGPKSSSKSPSHQPEAIIPEQKPAEDAPPGKPDQTPVAKGKTSQSNKRSDPLPTAYVEVLYKNRLSKSEMTISIDGQVVWRRNLTVSNLVKKVMGKQVRTEISVPQGVHSVRVRISSPEAGINATDTLRTLFHGGEARVLGVSLDTEDKKLSLYWKG
jgi:serine/threonine protein kinase